MNSDQDFEDFEDFEDLRKLMALKKYEQPPPRYFSELPSQIWVRLEREGQTTTFWARFFPNLGLNPALAYSFGLLACGSLVFGIGYSLNTEPEANISGTYVNESALIASPRVAIHSVSELNISNYQTTQLASTNPVMHAEPLPSLFNTLPSVQVAPASYTPDR